MGWNQVFPRSRLGQSDDDGGSIFRRPFPMAAFILRVISSQSRMVWHFWSLRVRDSAHTRLRAACRHQALVSIDVISFTRPTWLFDYIGKCSSELMRNRARSGRRLQISDGMNDAHATGHVTRDISIRYNVCQLPMGTSQDIALLPDNWVVKKRPHSRGA